MITELLRTDYPTPKKTILIALRAPSGKPCWMVGICIRPKANPQQLWFRRDGDHEGVCLCGGDGMTDSLIGWIPLANVESIHPESKP